MKKFILVFFLFTILYSLITVVRADAQTVCQPIYGGGQSCPQVGNILIDKKVLNPGNNVFVDNLGINDPKIAPLGSVFFQLAITITGNVALPTASVKDVFPQFIDFASGAGNFDNSSKTLSFDLFNLQPNETRVFTLIGRVVDANRFPSDKSIVCVLNQATVTSPNTVGSQDNAQVCILNQAGIAATPTPVVQIPVQTKGGLKVFSAPTTKGGTPATGPEALYLLAFLPTGALGYFIRKKSILA